MFDAQRPEIHRIVAINLMAGGKMRVVVDGLGVRSHTSRQAQAEERDHDQANAGYMNVFHFLFFLFWLACIAAMCF